MDERMDGWKSGGKGLILPLGISKVNQFWPWILTFWLLFPQYHLKQGEGQPPLPSAGAFT